MSRTPGHNAVLLTDRTRTYRRTAGSGGRTAVRVSSSPTERGVRCVAWRCDAGRMNDRHPPELVITNRVPPVGTPGARPMGGIPVIVRLVLEDDVEQWRPATANR